MPHADAYFPQFENRFLKAKGDAFQTFFEELMGRAYRGDFMACRPWGKDGDRKNDGFLKSERRLFQVYAPNEMTKAAAVAKIKADFAGALQHWRTHFDHWTFVHNAHDGLPPHVQQVILDTERANLGVTIETWSLHELTPIFRTLSETDLAVWLGRLPLSGPALPFQLPPAASEFFGRGEALANLQQRLCTQPRTEVHGGPGMGKTALAAEALAALLPEGLASLADSPFPDGIVFLDLYLQKGSTENAWHALANAIDDSVPAELPGAERARRACAHRRLLLILEGAEELLGGPADPRDRLPELLAVLAPETRLLVLTREKSQTAAGRRIGLGDLLDDENALRLLRHLAGVEVPQPVITDVQGSLGGHPLALTWAASQLADATQPPDHFLRDLLAQPFAKLTEPGGVPEHTLQWMFDRSVRHMADSVRTVLAAAARVSEPFGPDLAETVGGTEGDLIRLVQHAFLRVVPGGWQFAHALAARYAGLLPLPEALLRSLGQWAIAGIHAADARCLAEGTGPLGQALAHATSLLAAEDSGRVLRPLVTVILWHDRDDQPLGIRRGRLDLVLRAVDAVRLWQQAASTVEQATPAWQRALCVSLDHLGELSMVQGDVPSALRFFTEYHQIASRLAASVPSNQEWQRDLGASLSKLGDVAVAQGDSAAALLLFTESKVIAAGLSASDPANAEWQRDLIISHERLGDLAENTGLFGEAREHFELCRMSWARLIDQAPENLSLQGSIMVPLCRLGNLALERGDMAAALGYFAEANDVAVRLVASDPTNAQWQRGHHYSQLQIAKVHLRNERWREALALMEQSRGIAERLAASDPSNLMWQEDRQLSRLVVVLTRFVEALKRKIGA